MISTLLKSLYSLDYILIAIKSTDNRLTESSQFIYSSVQNLYAEDIANRVLGMFTFSDGNKPGALTAVKGSGIKINDQSFKFNNSAMWVKPDAMENNLYFFDLGMINYSDFTNFVKSGD